MSQPRRHCSNTLQVRVYIITCVHVVFITNSYYMYMYKSGLQKKLWAPIQNYMLQVIHLHGIHVLDDMTLCIPLTIGERLCGKAEHLQV